MKINFCTLFNSSYLSRGMVMYDSLLKNCDDFHLYIFAFDDVTYKYLTSQKLEHLTVISLNEFEDEELLKVKPTRSAAEYCWTCTASTILYSIKKFQLSNCTYIDADLLFYSNPKVLIEEMGNDSVLITEHRYSKEHEQSATSGKYCVQFVTFKNDERGMKVLNWWREACLDWCYARHEDGKFGDQKYLDDWTTRFEGVHELQHLGGGIAPWNVAQYSFSTSNNKLKGTEIATGEKFDVVFYHFHQVKFFDEPVVSISLAGYTISEDVKKCFYFPYIKLINKKREFINSTDNSFNSNGTYGKSPMKPINAGTIVYYYLKDLKASIKNIFGRNLKYRIAHHYFYNLSDFKND